MKRLFPILTILTALALNVCHRSEVGWISIQSTPEGAEVYLDDSLTGEVTNCVLDDVPAGEHTIKLTLQWFKDWVDTINVIPDHPDTIEATLELEVSDGTILWTFDSSGKSPAVLSFDGTIYLPGSTALYAINNDGTLRWSFPGVWYPLISLGPGNVIYAMNEGGSLGISLLAINEDGILKWELDLSYGTKYGFVPSIAENGTIYVSGKDGRLTAVTPDGEVLWEYPDYDVMCSPVIGKDGVIYCGLTWYDLSGPPYPHYLCAIYPDGSNKWEIEIEGEVQSLAIGPDETIYCTYRFGFCAFNPNDGSVKWKKELYPHYIAVGEDGTIYLGDYNSGRIYALSPGGSVLWNYYTGQPGNRLSPTVGADGTIYFVSNWGQLYVLSPEGSLLWHKDIGGAACAIQEDGVLYVANNDGLHAIKTSSSGLANSTWPKYCHDNQNTGNAAWPIR